MTETWKSNRITTKTTTSVIAESCIVAYIVISVLAAGTDWTIQIRDKAGTPLVLAFFEMAESTDGQPVIINLKDFPVPMTGGIDIITAGTTAGEVVVRMYLGVG